MNKRPRVSFFQEDLAASRPTAAPDYIPYTNPPGLTAYTFTPDLTQIPSFYYYCNGGICGFANATYNNAIVFQANTVWSGPFGDFVKTQKTLNGTPNDGMEAAFNAYYGQYLEVYTDDLDHAQPVSGTAAWDASRWKAGLDSWHDYTAHVGSLAPMDGPAGLTVARTNATSNTVNWYAVYGASTYTLQARPLSPLGDWANVKGCDPLSASCTDTASTGSQYAYRVQASDATGKILSPWSQVAVFLSESKYDGYVSASEKTSTPFPSDTEPGIQAGQGADSDLSGFVSFDTSVLGSAVTILDAELRLKQYTNSDGFKSLGTCMVDIQKGNFNSNVELEGADFGALETDYDVTAEDELAGVDAENWVEAELDPVYISDVNKTDRTQFRIYFDHVDGVSNTSVGWYSGEGVGNEPELIVHYTEP